MKNPKIKQRTVRVQPPVGDNPGLYRLDTTCVHCGRTFSSPLFTAMQMAWHESGQGPLVQDNFPNWTRSERELHLLSGLCDECWRKLLPPED